MTTRVGVIADSHCPEFLERLPDRLFKVFDGVQLILHAGDINSQQTLDRLSSIAPVHAVRGDHDRSLTSLPLAREVTVQGQKIVVVHGNRSRWLEEPHTLLWTITLGRFEPHSDLPRALQRRFPDADVIVFGHTHRSFMRRINGVLLFNPGAVYQWNRAAVRRRLGQRPGWFEWSWLQFARHLRQLEGSSVGVLEIDEDGIVPRIVGL